MQDDTNVSTMDTDDLAQNSYRQMVDYLENILIRQLERVRNYDLDGAMKLAEEVNSMAETIGREKILDRPEFADELWRIQRLYKDLGLIISSERQEVAGKLKQIRKGIKALGIYNDNL